jgi:lipoate-protein ligase B
MLEPHSIRSPEPALEAHFLGRVAYDDALALQRRLVYEAGETGGERSANVSLLLCEHESLITVGRGGSRWHIRHSEEQLASRRVEVRFVSRGGGCVVHGPGQLAIYPIVPLAARGWSVGEFLAKFQRGLQLALDDMRVAASSPPGKFSLWGRTGVVAVMAAAVKHNVTCHGAFINVETERGLGGYVDVVDPASVSAGVKTTMASLLSERGRPVRMSAMRAALAVRLAEAFDCPRHHLHTGHPLLRTLTVNPRDNDLAFQRTADPLA